MVALNDEELYSMKRIKEAFLDAQGSLPKFLTKLRQLEWHPEENEVVFNLVTMTYMPFLSTQDQSCRRLTPAEGGYAEVIRLLKEIGENKHPFPDIMCRDFLERFDANFKPLEIPKNE